MSSSSSNSQSKCGEPNENAQESDQKGVDRSSMKGAFDVVTVHGLHGGGQSTWEARDPEERNTLKGIKNLESELECRILHYSYDRPKAFSGSDIALEASRLLLYISNARRGLKPEAHRPIALVSHDIGGAIVKRALYLASTDLEYATIAHSTRLLIFFGYPHRCRDLQQMTDAVARDVPPESDYVSLSTSFPQIISLAQTIIDCNDLFAEAKFMLRANLINIYSSKANPGEYVFDEWMATMGLIGEVKIPNPKIHANLACASAEEDVWSSISIALKRFKNEHITSENAMEDIQIRELSAFSSPHIYLRTRSGSDSEGMRWLMDHENFTTWRNSSRSSGLVVQTSGPSDAISESIFEAIKEREVLDSIYFSFDCHDNRRSNMRTFLHASISQWARYSPEELREEANYLHLLHYRSFTERDALYTWTTMLTCAVRTKAFFVLNNADESEDMNPSFWEHLACLFENKEMGPWKFILFTKPGHEMHERLSHWPRINMDEQEMRLGLGHDVEQEISHNHEQLLYSRHLRVSERLLNASIHEGNWGDVGLMSFMTGQLLRVVRRPTGTPSKDAVRRLYYLSPEELAEETMCEVPEEDRSLVSDVLSWIICAVRPLSLDELQSASAFTIGHPVFNQSLYLASTLDELLPGMLDFSNRRVRFSHRRLHDFFEHAEDVWFAVKHTAHGLMTQICLDSLRSTTSLDTLLGLCNFQQGILGTPVSKPQNNLTSYATEYWPQHYSLASDRASLLKLVMTFFQSGKIVRKWEGARWIITNPFTRTDRSYLKSLLPLIASTGLCDVFHQQLQDEEQRSATEATSHLPFALAEALRNGHAELANNILHIVNLDDPQTAEFILLAALSYGENEDLQISLVTHVSKHLGINFTWPDPLIFRASWLGQARLVEKLIQCNASIQVRGEYRDRPNVLQAALLNGHLEVVRILLSKDESLSQGVDDAERTALEYAAITIRPEPEVARHLLLSSGTDVHAPHGRAWGPVMAACIRGNHAVLCVILDGGVKPDSPGDEVAPLAIAASCGFAKCVQALLEHGANPNGEGQEEGPAIVESAMKGYFEIVQLLVKHGADINARSKGCLNAIIAAVHDNTKVEMVKYFLDRGVDVESKHYRPLVSWAASGRNVEILRVILQAGADTSTTDENGWAPIHHACYHSTNCIRPLLEADRACLERAVDGDAEFPLYIAVAVEKMDAIEILLEYNPNVDQLCRNDEGQRSALHIAAMILNIGIARKLLEAGADANLKTAPNGYSALYLGVSNEEFLKMLLEFEPDVNLTDNEDNTALNYYLISERAKLSIVKMLVLEGANVKKANKNGITPLHRAATQKNPDIVRLLLKLGADANATSTILGTPLHVSCWLGTPETVKLLVRASVDVMHMHPKSGHPACSACYRVLRADDRETAQQETNDILRYLLKENGKTVNVNRVGGDHGCLLGMACYFCSTETINIVLEAKADINLQTTFGRRPIHFAAYSTVENFRRLEEAGAHLDVRDNMGRTVLHCAVQGGNIDVVKYVLQVTKGLLHVADDDGWTALHYAARGCDVLDREKRIERRGRNADEERFQIISYLVDQGSEITAFSSGPNRRWTPAMLAQFHGATQDTQDLLMPVNGTWPDGPRKMERAHTKDTTCKCCFVKIEGLSYKSKFCIKSNLGCIDFDLCYKCYPVREHSQYWDRGWEEIGPEYLPDDSGEPEVGSDSASVSESESET